MSGAPSALEPRLPIPNRTVKRGSADDSARKAQNKSLLLFSGEAYNVEMGITNALPSSS